MQHSPSWNALRPTPRRADDTPHWLLAWLDSALQAIRRARASSGEVARGDKWVACSSGR